MVSNATVLLVSMLITPLYVLFPVEIDVAVDAESGQKDVLSKVCAEPVTGKFIKDNSCV